MSAKRATAKAAGRTGRSDGRAGGAARPDEQAAIRQAAGHSRIRRDHALEIAEDYVELIAQLLDEQGEARAVDVARRLGVSHVTVTKTIARLQREGLVETQPYRAIFLTEKGHELARRIAARHELVVRFLKAIGVNEQDAEVDAEGIEHHVSDATLTAMKNFLARDR